MTGDSNAALTDCRRDSWAAAFRCLLAVTMLLSSFAMSAGPVAASAQVPFAGEESIGDSSDAELLYLVTLDESAVAIELSTAPGRRGVITDDVVTTVVDSMIDDVLVATSPVPIDVTHRYHKVVKGFAASLTADQVAQLRADPRIAVVERDRGMQLYGDQADPSWGLDRIDEVAPVDDGNYHWDFDGAGVHLYVVDTGIRADHIDFTDRIGTGIDIADGDDDPADCSGHGTHVSSTAAGTTWGVAKEVTIHPVRVFRCGGSTSTSVVIAGLDWIAENHVKPAVVNMSLGGEGSAVADSAVQELIDLGITVVVAAGNDASDACRNTPASEGSVITVGSTNQTDGFAGFSNWGPCVDLLAPGDGIRAASIGSPAATRSLNGTSMSSPFVAGAAALVLAEHPAATPQQVMDLLIESSTRGAISNLPRDTPNRLLHTLGINDALPMTLELQPNVVSSVGGDIGGSLEASGPDASTAAFSPTGLPDGVELSAAGDFSGAPTARGRSNVEVAVTAAGREYFRRFQWHVVVPGNGRPEVQDFANDVVVLAGSNPRFWFHVNDPDLDFAGIDFSTSSDDLVFRDSGFGSTPEARRLQITDIPAGAHEITLQAYDFRGGASPTRTFRITAVASLPDVPNPDPALSAQGVVAGILGQPLEIELDAVGDDPNVAFGASQLVPGLTLDPATGLISGVPQALGEFDVRATITNLQGQSASQRFTISIGLVQPEEVEPFVTLGNSCEDNNGRLAFDLVNDTDSAVSFTVSVGGQPDAVVVVPAGSSVNRVYSGLDDGAYAIGVNVAGEPILSGREVVACDAPPPEAAATVSCLNEDGRIDLEVSNLFDDFAVFRATFDDRLPRATGLPAGMVSRLTITGRRDGPIDVRVSRDDELVFARTMTIACDVVEPVEIRVSCLANNGRVDVLLHNTSEQAVDYSVTVGALNPRELQLAGGANGRLTVTGRPDGTYPVVVSTDGVLTTESIDVDCDPEEPVNPGSDDEVAVQVSCLGANGRVDVTLTNTTDATSTYAVKVGALDPRVRTVASGGAVTVSVTGRRDGDIAVVVSRGSIEIFNELRAVACD